MAYYIVQSGSTLQKMTPAGVLTTLTLPTNVTVDSTKRMRADTLGNLCVVVNSPSENLVIDTQNNVTFLTPRPPTSAVVLAASVAAGVLTGSYKVKCTFAIKDADGNVISESGFSPESLPITLTAKDLLVSSIPVSVQPGITHRRLYRTTASGSTYYLWVELDGNVATTIQEGTTDILLQTIAADTDFGTPPTFTIIKQWQNRLWGRGTIDPDSLRYSGIGRIFAWSASQAIPIPPPRTDIYGITAIVARRDELGVGKRNAFHVVRGTNETNFTRYAVAEGTGVWATDSVVVIRDTAYFLGNPFGIYKWGADGLKNISDEKVKSWFASDTYFNRANFLNAVGGFDPVLNSYVLLLSSPGQTTLDRWIQLNLTDETWWGPHKTAEFTPTYVTTLLDANDVGFLSFGSTGGKLYAPQTTKTDGASSAIDLDVTTGHMTGNTPSEDKLWGRLGVVSQVEASAGILQMFATMGRVAAEKTIGAHDLSKEHEEMNRLGTGHSTKIRVRQNTAGHNVVLYGIELPFHELGERNR